MQSCEVEKKSLKPRRIKISIKFAFFYIPRMNFNLQITIYNLHWSRIHTTKNDLKFI